MSGLYNGTRQDKEESQAIECKLAVNEVDNAHIIQLRSQARMLPGLGGPSPVTTPGQRPGVPYMCIEKGERNSLHKEWEMDYQEGHEVFFGFGKNEAKVISDGGEVGLYSHQCLPNLQSSGQDVLGQTSLEEEGSSVKVRGLALVCFRISSRSLSFGVRAGLGGLRLVPQS